MQNYQFLLLLFSPLIYPILHYFNFFSKSYIQKKGENLATKQDVEEITKIVEDIKLQNSLTSALLNANLSLASKGIENFDEEAFKSYIEYHQTITSILYVISIIDFTKLDYRYIDLYTAQQDDIHEYSIRITTAKLKVDLFNDIGEIDEITFKMHFEILFFLKTLTKNVNNIKFSIERINFYQKEIANYFIEKRNRHLILNQLRNDLNEFESLLDESKKEHINSLNSSNYKNCIKYMTEFQYLIKSKIKEERMKKLNGN